METKLIIVDYDYSITMVCVKRNSKILKSDIIKDFFHLYLITYFNLKLNLFTR